MPLNEKGRKILSSLTEEYGESKGKSVLYAMKNSGKVSGIDKADARDPEALLKAAEDELEALGEAQEEVAARQGAIDDRTNVIKRLHDEIRGDKDPVGDVVRIEREQELVRHIGDAVADLSKRMDKLAERLGS